MKNYIKKLIISIVFVMFLIIFFFFGKTINDNRKKDEISLVKSIISEKHKYVNYIDNSKYIYTMDFLDSLYKYTLYDLSGNRLYTIINDKELNIIYMSKKYFITKDNEYRLYDSDYNLITSSKNITAINDYLIKVDNKIIDLNNNVVFDKIESLTLYNDNNNLYINNKYLTDKRGNILLDNIKVKEEIKSNSLTDYLVIEKNNKYYTFFVKVNMIIGDGFDKYIKNNNLYIKNNRDTYKVYKTGLRKKITDKSIIKRIFSKKNKNVINHKNGYKTIKKDNNYYLINKDGKEVFKSNKQIIMYGIKTKNVDKEFIIYNLDTKKEYLSKKIRINKKTYYKMNNEIVSSNYKEKYKSKDYISFYKNTIIYKKDNKLIFKNLKNKKEYYYTLDKNEEIINSDLDKLIIIRQDNDTLLLGLKGNIIKKLKNKKIDKYYKINDKILLITELEKNNIKYKGSYLAE